MRQFEQELGGIDVIVNGFDSNLLVMTNLTGHPQIHLPMGADERGNGKSLTVVGRLYKDDRLLETGWAIQRAFPKYKERPDFEKLG